MADITVTTARKIESDLPEGTAQMVVLGAHYWGKGTTLAEAKRQFRAAGGSLSNGYLVYAFPEGLTELYVDALGRVAWEWAEGSDPIQPLATLGVRGPHANF